VYDLTIIGGGPAGTAAAVYAARKRMSTLLTSKDLGGQVLVDKAQRASNLTTFLNHEVTRVDGANRVESIAIRASKDGEEKMIEVGAVFVEIGLVPNPEVVRDLVRLNGPVRSCSPALARPRCEGFSRQARSPTYPRSK